MNKQVLLALFIGLVLGLGGMFLVNTQTRPANQATNTVTPTIAASDETQATTHSAHSMDQMSMGEMTAELQGKTGDEFDRVFIQAMIGHHQGAIDMAELAKTQAKHVEIKTMAEDIITAQSTEITLMQDWQKEWGY